MTHHDTINGIPGPDLRVINEGDLGWWIYSSTYGHIGDPYDTRKDAIAERDRLLTMTKTERTQHLIAHAHKEDLS